MNKDPLFDHLREQAWRRKLSPGQEAQLSEWLAAHPEAREDWEAELALNEAFGRLPDVPVASNFTARVVQTIELGSAQAKSSTPRRLWSWPRWVRWAAACSVIILAGLFGYQRHVREEWADSIAMVSRVAPLSPEILTNFDVICALDRTPAPDEDLLKLLQ